MGARTDAALTLLVLAVVVITFALVDASLSPLAATIGGLGTVAFELVAARDVATVRRYWQRPFVHGASVVAAVLVIVVGARVAPDAVLSLFVGGAVTYLAFLVVVSAVRRA